MSIKAIKALTFMAASLLAANTFASDGTINFTGEIVAASCSIAGGAGTSVSGGEGTQIVTVDMGKVSMDSIGAASGVEGSIAAGKNINLNLDCGASGAGLTTVKVSFDPASGSGFDASNNALLAIDKGEKTAKGVGIGIFNSDSELLDLRADDYFTAALVASGGGESEQTYSADLNIRAAYVANGEKMEAGRADASLPFTITYQ